MRLYVDDDTDAGGAWRGEIRRVSNDKSGGDAWTESNLVWTNKPDTTGRAILDTEGSVNPRDVVVFAVTDSITGNGTYSFAISETNKSKVTFHSKEGWYSPELIVYTTPNTPPVATNDTTTTSKNDSIAIAVTDNDTGILEL